MAALQQLQQGGPVVVPHPLNGPHPHTHPHGPHPHTHPAPPPMMYATLRPGQHGRLGTPPVAGNDLSIYYSEGQEVNKSVGRLKKGQENLSLMEITQH